MIEQEIIGCKIQDVSTTRSILIEHKVDWPLPEEEGNGDESDKHVEALDRRYSCLSLSV